MPIGETFDETIDYYDRWMKIALPGYTDLFGTAVGLVPYPVQDPIRVLDLGAGTGLFSSHILERYPQASFVLYDLAEKMLGAARQRFEGQQDQFRYIVGDYRALNAETDYEVVISSLSIHHLTHADKQALFRKIFTALKPGGVFLNIDQVKGPTPEIQEMYWNRWLARVRRSDATEDQVQASIERRRTYDIDALLTDQLAWLTQAGFTQVDCMYKHDFVGVFYAVR
ncbi:MAG: class I SAM-dependent methyltransferase [Anaerolineales bacterium]|nr:class I SAM-dependent methyltransferase [Anaerolineales bacterium]